MDSFDDDMFSFSDEDIKPELPQDNPVQEYLTKQLCEVHSRIERTKDEIGETRQITDRILKTFFAEATYGENVSSDSDNDLYTFEGEPRIKGRTSKNVNKDKQTMIVKDKWQCILGEKWIIGIMLQNLSRKTLLNPIFYVWLHESTELLGTSMFWQLIDETYWSRILEITPSATEVVATVVLDLPNFDQNPVAKAFGTISYEIDEKDYQIPISSICLSAVETIDTYSFKYSNDIGRDILTLKSVCIEKTIEIPLQPNPQRGEKLLKFLQDKFFEQISADVFVVKAPGSLINCLVEVLPIIDNNARFRISAGSNVQMNVMVRLLRDEFPDMTTKEDDDRVIETAKVLVEELEMYFEDKTPAEIQRARLKTDLLIP